MSKECDGSEKKTHKHVEEAQKLIDQNAMSEIS